jgi:hypothetical protein
MFRGVLGHVRRQPVAFIALFIALGGSSYAALALPKNSVGTKQLKNGAVTGSKIKAGAISSAKINTAGLTVPDAQHSHNADTATVAGGAPPLAYAHVRADGSFDAANSRNVTADVPNAGSVPNVTCLVGIPFTVKGAQVTVDFNDSGTQFAQVALGAGDGTHVACPAGTKAYVWTANTSNGVGSPAAFFVELYG